MAWTAVFSRIFNAAEFGRYSLVFSVVLFLVALSSQWLVQSTNRYLASADREETRRILKSAVFAGLLLIGLGVGIVVVGVLAFSGRHPVWRPYLWAGGALWMVTALYSPLLAVLQAEMRSSTYSVYHVAHVALRFGLAVLLVTGVWLHPAGLLWGGVLAVLLIFPVLVRSVDLPAPTWVWRHRRRSARVLRLMVGYGLPMVGWWLASTLLNVGDQWVIQWARGPGEVGIYSANYQIVTGATGLMAAPVLLAAHPFLMRAWGTEDRHRAGEWISAAVQLILVIGAVLVGLVSVFAPDIARLLLGEAFREGHVIMPVVLAGLVAWQAGMYTHKPLEFLGRTRLLLVLGMGAAFLNLLLNFLWIPVFGYRAAAVTTLVAYGSYVLATGMVGRRLVPWRLPWLRLGVVLGIVGVAFAAAGWLRNGLLIPWGYWPATWTAAVVALVAAGAAASAYLAALFRGLER